MPRLAVRALLLRVVDFGEADRIVHLLTPERGRLAALAKSARKSQRRFPGTLDVFNHLAVELSLRRDGRLALLERARLVDPFLGLRRDPRRYALASYLLELLDRLAPEGGAPRDLERLFGFGVGALESLAAATPGPAQRVLLELRALEALGLRPELRRCVRCGGEVRGASVGFHVADGGAVCAACAPGLEGVVPAHLGTLRALERGLSLPLPQLSRLALDGPALAEAQRLMTRFHRFHVGVELRSEPFLDAMLGPGAARPRGSV